MVDQGPWEPVEQSDGADDEGDEQQEEGRDFWDYALIGVVLAIIVVAAVAIVSSQSASTQWSLDVRGEMGESEETIVIDGDTITFDAGVGFAGRANGDVVENVQLRAIGINGSTLGTTCLGTLTNDADHEMQTVQLNLSEAPGRVIVEATAVRNDSSFIVRGWSNDAGAMGGDSLFVQNRSTYINESACQ